MFIEKISEIRVIKMAEKDADCCAESDKEDKESSESTGSCC